MRATEGNRRVRTWRKLTGIVIASTLALSVLGGDVLAGNTSKQVYFGSGPFPATPAKSFTYPANYSLSFTPVSGGAFTSFFVTIQNKATGTLNHVVIEGGNQAPNADANANFVPDGTNGSSPPICTAVTGGFDCIDSLPVGFTYVASYLVASDAPTALPCKIYDSSNPPAPTTGPGRGISCDVGQLTSGASVTYRIAMQVPAFVTPPVTGPDPNAYGTWLTASGNEGTSNQGSNQDAFFALGTVNVGLKTDCSDANFFTGGQFSDFGAATCDQPATLSAGTFSSGAFAAVKVAPDPDNLCGLINLTCFGKRVDANVEFGASVPGGLQWTVLWLKSSLNGSPKTFIHFKDAFFASPRDLTAYEIISFKSTPQCPAAPIPTTSLPCLNGKPGFTPVGGISYFKVVFTTAGNGAGRGG